MDDRTVHFHLAGINNQNFLMRDEETGSWWQQASGECIRGAMRGRKLDRVPHDELAWSTWKREHPGGRVLRPDPSAQAEDNYESADWEEHVARFPVVVPAAADEPLGQREIVLGLVVGQEARAYPLAVVRESRVVEDDLGGVPIALVVASDGRSVRAFDRRANGRTLSFYAPTGPSPLDSDHAFIDAETTSAWSFQGVATSGELAGTKLARVEVLPDYWFDWKVYHPETTAYRR